MKDLIEYDDFDKLDIRVGLVTAVSIPEWSEKLIRYEVDLGEEIGKRVLFSGIRKWYKPEEMIGKKMPIIINLEPKKMGEEESQGMAIMMDGENGASLIFLPEETVPGTVIR